MSSETNTSALVDCDFMFSDETFYVMGYIPLVISVISFLFSVCMVCWTETPKIMNIVMLGTSFSIIVSISIVYLKYLPSWQMFPISMIVISVLTWFSQLDNCCTKIKSRSSSLSSDDYLQKPATRISTTGNKLTDQLNIFSRTRSNSETIPLVPKKVVSWSDPRRNSSSDERRGSDIEMQYRTGSFEGLGVPTHSYPLDYPDVAVEVPQHTT